MSEGNKDLNTNPGLSTLVQTVAIYELLVEKGIIDVREYSEKRAEIIKRFDLKEVIPNNKE